MIRVELCIASALKCNVRHVTPHAPAPPRESPVSTPATSSPEGLGKSTVKVVSKETVADGVVRLTLADPVGERLPYWTSGAHIDLVVPTAAGQSVVRQYSLCGDRWDAFTYQVAVLREPRSRGGSHHIHDSLQVGDLISIGTPRNNFALKPAKTLEFIAGGIGITPIMTMIDSAERMGIDWHLLYGGRSRQSLAFLDELEPYGDRVTVCPHDETGLLDLSYLNEPVQGSKVYCCGPEPLLDAVERATSRWSAGTVRFERFVAAAQPPPVLSGPFTVELARSQTSVVVDSEESILQALERVGRPVLASCYEGICGTCEVTVVDGVADHRDSLLTDAERAVNDRMFVCVSRSATKRLVLDL